MKKKELCRNYNSNVKMFAHRAQLNFQTADIITAALKLEAYVTNAATHYMFSSIKDNA